MRQGNRKPSLLRGDRVVLTDNVTSFHGVIPIGTIGLYDSLRLDMARINVQVDSGKWISIEAPSRLIRKV